MVFVKKAKKAHEYSCWSIGIDDFYTGNKNYSFFPKISLPT
jgi:hypothetical protein